MAHGDAVGHRYGAELARGGSDGGSAALDRLSLAHQGDVAGRRLIPAGRDAHKRLVDLLAGQTHGVVEGAMRRPLRAFGGVAAWQPRLQICLCVHFTLRAYTRPLAHAPDLNSGDLNSQRSQSQYRNGSGSQNFCPPPATPPVSKNPMAKKGRGGKLPSGATKCSNAVAG